MSFVSDLGGAVFGGSLGPLVFGSAASAAGALAQGWYNHQEAKTQRNWEENMSSSAYQRAAYDLEAAGLNRVLALGSPASTPSSAAASIAPPKFAEGAIAAASAKQQIDQSRSLVQLQAAQKALSEEQTKVAALQGLKTIADTQNTSAATAKTAAETALLKEELPKRKVERAGYEAALPLVQQVSSSVKQITESFAEKNREPGTFDGLWYLLDGLLNTSKAHPWYDNKPKQKK